MYVVLIMRGINIAYFFAQLLLYTIITISLNIHICELNEMNTGDGGLLLYLYVNYVLLRELGLGWKKSVIMP